MITAAFTDNSDYARATGLWQWDYGQRLRIEGLKLPTAVEIHFALTEQSGDAITRVGTTKDGVTEVVIPDSLLENQAAGATYEIYAWIYLADNTSGETIKRISMQVKRRPKPEGFDAPEDAELFRDAIEAVNASADRAEAAREGAEAAQRAAEEAAGKIEGEITGAGQIAEQVRQDAAAVAQDKQAVSQMVTETTQNAQNAASSAQAAESFSTAAKEAQTAAESAEAGAAAAMEEVERDRTEVSETHRAVELLRGAVDTDRQAVAADRRAVENTALQFGQAAQNALTAVGQAQEAAVGAVSAEGQRQTTAVQQAGTQAVSDVETAKTTAVQAVTTEGDTQVGRVQDAAAGIVADREQIAANKAGIEALQEDLEDLKKTAYTDTFFRNFFAMQRTGKKYTVRFPLWETSQIATGEKLDDNAGLIIEPSTITEKGRDDYEVLPLFRTYDCNVEKINGELKITAMKGDSGYNPKEKDTFVLGMPYYHKAWIQDGYLYYSRSDIQHEGYILCPEAGKTDGMRNFCLYGKYIAGRNSQGTLGSYYGANPARNLPSYNNNITESKKRGEEYCFGSSYDYAYIQNTFLIKYADRNWNNVLGGCFTYNYQHLVSVPESNTNRVVLKKSEAEKFLVGSCVLVGDAEDTSKAPDRSNAKAYNLCDSAKIIDIVDVDAENKALVLDIAGTITTTATTWVSAIHWKSGFSDDILGRDGCPCQTKNQISSMLYPSVIQGIELMVGGYETLGNAFMDIVDGLTGDVYVCTDPAKLTTNITTAKTNYTKLAKQMTVEKNTAWCHGTEIFIDTENGMNIITKAGASGSGSNTGFCDGIYFGNAENGQREFLLLGNLGNWGLSGAFCSICNDWLGNAWWGFLARLSLSVFRGEFA